MTDKTSEQAPSEGASDDNQFNLPEEYKGKSRRLRKFGLLYGFVIIGLLLVAGITIICARDIIGWKYTEVGLKELKTQEKSLGKKLEKSISDLDELRKEKESLEVPLFNRLALNKNLAIAVGDNGLVLVSTDKGKTWKSRSLQAKKDINSVAISKDGEVTIAVGDDGLIQGSVDKGMTWKMRTTNTEADFNAVALGENGEVAIAVGNKGLIQVSTDKGETWEAHDTHTRDRFNAVAISDDGKLAVAVGDDGTLRVLSNKNKTWLLYKHDIETRKDFNAVAISDDGNLAVAVGDDGMFRVSVDQGKNWMESDDKAKKDFNAVALSGDGNLAVAVGDNGMFRVPVDQGGNWRESSGDFETRKDFNAVTLSGDSQFAIAVGDDGFAASVGPGLGKWTLLDDVTATDLETVVMDDEGTRAIAMGRYNSNSVILEIKKQNGQSFSVERIASYKKRDREKVIDEERWKKINSEIPEKEKEISFLEGEKEQIETTIVNRKLEAGKRDWLEINFFRVGIIMIMAFFSQHLFGLIRYNIRVAKFYDSCSDAFLLSGKVAPLDKKDIRRFEKILDSLSTKDLDFGRPPSGTMLSQVMDGQREKN